MKSRANNRNVAKIVHSVLASKLEQKRFSLATVAAATATGGLVVPLTQSLILGDTVSSRDGDVITPLKLELNFTVTNTGGGTATLTRVIIFQDRLNVGVAPTVANLLDGSAFNSSYALLTTQQRRFKILSDKVHTTVNTASNQSILDKMSFKLKGQIFYNGDTNVTTANGKNSIWILVVGDNVSGTYSHYSSLVYTDQ